MSWWDDEAMLYNEDRAIREQFPHFNFDAESGHLILRGSLRTNRRNYYALKVIYPANFPYSEPQIFVEGAEIDGSYYESLPWLGRPRIHMYSLNHVCWNDRNRAQTWDPRRSTAVVALTTMAVWLFCYEAYVFDGDPWLGSDH